MLAWVRDVCCTFLRISHEKTFWWVRKRSRFNIRFALTLITNSRWFYIQPNNNNFIHNPSEGRWSKRQFKNQYVSVHSPRLSAPNDVKISTGSELNFEFKFKGVCDKCSCMLWIIEVKLLVKNKKHKRHIQKKELRKKITNSKSLTKRDT